MHAHASKAKYQYQVRAFIDAAVTPAASASASALAHTFRYQAHSSKIISRMFWIEVVSGSGLDFAYWFVLGFVGSFVSDLAATDSLRFARSSTAAFGRGSFQIKLLTGGFYTNVLD